MLFIIKININKSNYEFLIIYIKIRIFLLIKK